MPPEPCAKNKTMTLTATSLLQLLFLKGLVISQSTFPSQFLGIWNLISGNYKIFVAELSNNVISLIFIYFTK